MTEPRTGVLVVNLGTPDAPTAGDVRRYLAEFLADPRVLDIHPVARWMLLHGVILRTRPAQSAAAYRKIWTEAGSPLRVHGDALVSSLRGELDAEVVLAMRYGTPSITAGLAALDAAGCERIVLVPLYPHYASSSTGSTLERVHREMAGRWNAPALTVVPPFYDAPAFIDALVAVGRPEHADFTPDHVLFSYHGLPERHMRKGDVSGRHCLETPDCCAQIVAENRWCYRAQCFATTRAVVASLGLTEGTWTVGFQSRLGRTPWITPYTDELLIQLAAQGVRRLLVYCPAFVADCLETLEEIGIRALESFQEAGGEDLRLVPGLNATPRWVAALAHLIRQQAPWIGRGSAPAD